MKYEWNITELKKTDLKTVSIEELRELRDVLNKEFHHAHGEQKEVLGDLYYKVIYEIFER